MMAYQGVRAAIAVAPTLVRVAGAWGIAEAYRRVTTFFSEMSGGDGNKGERDSGPSSWHKAQKTYNDSKFWDSLKTGNIIKGKIVHFGENINQTYHTFRHVIEKNINPERIRRLVEQDLSNNLHKINPNKVFQGTIKFDGKSVIYRAYEHLSGKIKVGRITVGK
jgi:hypothetical protein